VTLTPTADTWMGDGAAHGSETHVDMSRTPTVRTAYISFTNTSSTTGSATLRINSPTASTQPSSVRILCASPVLTETMTTPPCAASAVVATFPTLRIGVNEVAIPASATPAPGQTITYVLERVQSNGGLIAISSRETGAATAPQLVITPAG
jgi:hypothetical protein